MQEGGEHKVQFPKELVRKKGMKKCDIIIYFYVHAGGTELPNTILACALCITRIVRIVRSI